MQTLFSGRNFCRSVGEGGELHFLTIRNIKFQIFPRVISMLGEEVVLPSHPELNTDADVKTDIYLIIIFYIIFIYTLSWKFLYIFCLTFFKMSPYSTPFQCCVPSLEWRWEFCPNSNFAQIWGRSWFFLSSPHRLRSISIIFTLLSYERVLR